MALLFKLLENELDMVYSSLCQTYAYVKNIETFTEGIIEYDDKDKYTKEMISIIKDISQRISTMFEKIETEQEYIKEIKDKIVRL